MDLVYVRFAPPTVVRLKGFQRLQAHMELDIKAKIQLLNGVMGDPEDVVSMLRRQPHILAYSEVTIQVGTT